MPNDPITGAFLPDGFHLHADRILIDPLSGFVEPPYNDAVVWGWRLRRRGTAAIIERWREMAAEEDVDLSTATKFYDAWFAARYNLR